MTLCWSFDRGTTTSHARSMRQSQFVEMIAGHGPDSSSRCGKRNPGRPRESSTFAPSVSASWSEQAGSMLVLRFLSKLRRCFLEGMRPSFSSLSMSMPRKASACAWQPSVCLARSTKPSRSSSCSASLQYRFYGTVWRTDTHRQ